ncbi:MAG TPA: CHASE3 domain-containing protein, partial [Ferruginibacter sp.]|nr:CHASE3 domain-containing protein [Ferruginibacter sp.]
MEVKHKTFATGTSRRNIRIFFLAAMVVIIVFATFSFIRIRTLTDSSEIVNHTNLVKLKLEQVYSILRNAESSQRGYMLTGDSVFFKSYEQAKDLLDPRLDQLIVVTKDNPVQERNAIALRRLCDQRVAFLAAILAEGRDKPILRERWLAGKSIMDAISHRIVGMNAEEDRLLQVRSTELSKNEWNTPFVTIILTLCALLIITLSYFRILLELARSEKLKEEQDIYQQQLTDANERLSKSEERYLLMAAEVEDYAILLLSKDGIIENWNKGAERIKGYKADEIIGKHFSTFYGEEEKKVNLPGRLLKEAVENGKALSEGWRVRKDGTRFWGSIVLTALHDNKGEVIGFSKVTRDLTERRAAEENIRKHAEELEKKNFNLVNMNNELQSFAYVASHDLQEPLRKIQVFISRIAEQDSMSLSDNAKEYFRRVQDSAKRMQVLIDDLLEYAQMNNTEGKFEDMNLGVVVAEVVNDLKET